MPLRLHLVHEADPRLLQRLDAMYSAIERLHQQSAHIIHNQETIMATLDAILADVTAESAGIDSLGVLITQLGEQVKGLTNGNLPADVQAKVDAIFTTAEANKAKINAAINAAPGSTPPTVAGPLPTTPVTPPGTAANPSTGGFNPTPQPVPVAPFKPDVPAPAFGTDVKPIV